jgi:hypothetical protein
MISKTQTKTSCKTFSRAFQEKSLKHLEQEEKLYFWEIVNVEN